MGRASHRGVSGGAVVIPVLSAAEARAADASWVSATGLPSLLLMETASRALADAARRERVGDGPVVVVAGPGNNGGDGWGAARWLAAWHVPVAVWSVQAPRTEDARAMAAAAKRLGVVRVEGLAGASCVVDALVGTGLTRALEGPLAEAVTAIVASGLPVVSADLPSGLHADTGAALGPAVAARRTVTFGAAKRGLYAGRGPSLCGAIEVVDLGLPLDAAGAERVELADLARRWPARSADAHKTRSGHLLVIAGSLRMAGAAVLACKGALASGVGLVTLVTPGGALRRLGALPPEVMVWPGGESDLWDGSLPPLERFTAGVVGPGVGGGAPLREPARSQLLTLARDARPWVIDADALVQELPTLGADRVRTPHAGEAARLLGLTPDEVQADRFQSAAALAKQGGVVVLKGPHTLVAQQGRPTSINTTGGPVLASGGTGDVLAGLIGGLLARGVPARDAARLAVAVHGLAGDRLAAARSDGAVASDVARALPRAIDQLVAASGARLPGSGPAGA